jgi:hypothetical protein
MSEVKGNASHVIGDVVGSREVSDRPRLHGLLTEAIEESNALHGGDLRITVGDEYQGSFATLGSALRAVAWLRVRLLPEVDVRHGVGTGEVRVLDPVAGVQDGPGWWAARSAIDVAAAAGARPRTRAVRTSYVASEPGREDLAAAVNAALAGRDQIVSGLDGRSLSVLRAMLAGSTQREVAEAEGISASAVSQRVRADGIGVWLETDDWLGGLT